jgi:DNA-binding transcriptional MerR regulator
VTTWTIVEAAEKCGLSQYTLRWYERIGLLGQIERGSDGRRRFSDGDLDWLSLLTKLRAASQRECLKLLDAKVGNYERCLAQEDRLGVPLAPIPGTKRVKWLEQNVAALDMTLTADELTALDPLASQVTGARY